MTSPGDKIKQLRQIANMSQDELGRRVGLQRAAINKYEKGTVENIPIKTIEAIAGVFDVSPSYLIGWSDTVTTTTNPLALEVKILQGVAGLYGKDSVDLLEHYVHLTAEGQSRVQQYVQDMSAIYDDSE